MPTLPNMGLITPTLGGDSGTWDDKINAAFLLVDAHDHTSGKGVQVPVAGLDIDDDIAMGGNGLTGVGLVDFNAVAALAAGANVLFVSSADGELYWRTTGGANVKLTSGSSINTSLVGGIVGDYTSVGAEVAFVDADQVYTFKDQSAPTKKWARLASGPVRIYENDTTESVYVEHAIAAAAAAPYTVTWPAALPVGTAAMRVSSAGAVSFGGNWHWVGAGDMVWVSGVTDATTRNGHLTASATSGFQKLIPLVVGERVTAIQIQYKGNSSGNDTLTVALYRNQGDGSNDSHGETISIDDGDTSYHASSICTFATPFTAAALESFYLDVVMRTGQEIHAIGYLVE